MRLKNKVALVTGGGSGIGRAMARRFAEEGAQVVVVDMNQEGGKETVALIPSAVFVHADARRREEVENAVRVAVATFGAIHVLVNNAGGGARGNEILEIDEETWDYNVERSLKPTYLVSRAALPHLVAAGGGSIVNVSTVNALTGLGQSAYAAAKAGVISLTQTMAVHYGAQNVRVNCLCPGTIVTPATERYWGSQFPDWKERLGRWYPLNRIGTPEEVANAALFLASDESSFITGAVIPVDGGLTAGQKLFGT